MSPLLEKVLAEITQLNQQEQRQLISYLVCLERQDWWFSPDKMSDQKEIPDHRGGIVYEGEIET
jgi:hypothetical protein